MRTTSPVCQSFSSPQTVYNSSRLTAVPKPVPNQRAAPNRKPPYGIAVHSISTISKNGNSGYTDRTRRCQNEPDRHRDFHEGGHARLRGGHGGCDGKKREGEHGPLRENPCDDLVHFDISVSEQSIQGISIFWKCGNGKWG